MTRPITIPEALRPRAQRIAALLVPRIIDSALVAWAGYTVDEPLEAVLETHDTARFTRPGHPGAELRMGFLTMLAIEEESRDVVQVKTAVQEERRTVKFNHPIEYETTITHEWGRASTAGSTQVRTWSEQAKSAWDVGLKASLGVTYSGISAAAEATAKYGEELARQKGGSDTETRSETETENRTQSERLKFVGPIDFTYDARREVITETATVRARVDFDAKIYFRDALAVDDNGHIGGVWEWTTFRSQLVPAARGLAPENMDYSVFASAAPSTHEMFKRLPVPDDELDALALPSDALVEFVVPYERIANESLTIL